MLKLTSRLASQLTSVYKVTFQVADAVTQLVKTPSLTLRSKTNKSQNAIRAVITPTFLSYDYFWREENKRQQHFSVDVSLTLCKQAPVSTCKKGQFGLSTTGWTKKPKCATRCLYILSLAWCNEMKDNPGKRKNNVSVCSGYCH